MATLSPRDLARVHLLTVLGLAAFAAVLVRLAFFDYSPGSEMFHPHGYCYLWQPDLVAAHVISDGLIGLSYVAISFTLIYLVQKARAHLPFSWMFVAFGGFIIACGATHFVEIWTLWSPRFWLAADVKIITAVASVATAAVLPPLVPKVLNVVSAAYVSEQRRLAVEEAHARLEQRVAERTAELSAALERAEAATREKEAFLSIVSHELRTPLNAILGWSRMLGRGRVEPGLLERGLTVIDRNARVQAQLVDDLLDMSRVTAGTIRLRTEPVDIGTVLEDAIDVVRPAAAAKSIELAAAAEDVHPVVMGDRRRLQQVVWNILSNAVKFTPRGGRVAIRSGVADGTAFIEVRDTGIGIDPSFMSRVFDRFSQADTSATRTHQGLGIGLAIARHLVELHGGTITAESAGVGAGATFCVELPTAPQAAATVREAEPAAVLPRLEGLRVLLVDDEPDARETIGTILERAGASVMAADSVDAALHRLQEDRFDVLLSDIGMPGKDGFSLLRRVRQWPDPQRAAIPAIAVSAYAAEEDRAKALAAGFEAHIAKPVTPEEVVRGVAALTPRGGQSSEIEG